MRMQPDSDSPNRPIEEPNAALERAFIDDFLRQVGHTRCSLQRMPIDRQTELLRAASAYATLKLTEIESRAQFVHDLTAS